MHAILDRYGLMARARRSRTHTKGTPLSAGLASECVVVHRLIGRVPAGNQRCCCSLTATDHAWPYLLCEAMESNSEQCAFTAFEPVLQERGPPQAIRSDNGVPFASPNGAFKSPEAVPFRGRVRRANSARCGRDGWPIYVLRSRPCGNWRKKLSPDRTDGKSHG